MAGTNRLDGWHQPVPIDTGCARLEWSVLDWNQSAIGFYASIGAKPQSEWVRYRLSGDDLRNFACSIEEK